MLEVIYPFAVEQLSGVIFISYLYFSLRPASLSASGCDMTEQGGAISFQRTDIISHSSKHCVYSNWWNKPKQRNSSDTVNIIKPIEFALIVVCEWVLLIKSKEKLEPYLKGTSGIETEETGMWKYHF